MRTKVIVLLVVVLAAAAPALAKRGHIVHVVLNNPPVTKIADMPMTVDLQTSPAVTGPVAAANDTMTARGAALVSPVGGSVYTPEQRASAEIRQLIRRLGD